MSVIDATSLFAGEQAGEMPDHFSFSSMSLAVTCPEAWRRRYLLRAPSFSSEALVTGTSVHAGIQRMYDTLRDKPDTSTRSLAASAIETATTRLQETSLDEATKESAEQTTIELLEVYAHQRPEHVKPIETEKRIEIRVADSDKPIIGYVDVEAETSIVEIKTSSKKVTLPSGAWRVQGMVYQSVIPKPVEWHVLVKQKTPLLIANEALVMAYDEHRVNRALGLVSATLERLQRLYDERGAFDEWPMDGVLHPWACGSCDARWECELGRSA